MLTPKEAYLLFIDCFPNSPAEVIGEWFNDNYYFISNSKHDDFVDDDYLINKRTGEITKLAFDEYVQYIQSLPNEELDKKHKSWKIEDL